MTAALIGYYTITPTHCGTGQAADAVDLPIAREAHSGHPILPATSIKGSLRDNFEEALGRDDGGLIRWFGPELNTNASADGGGSLEAGNIVFGEGRLLAFPVRCLHTAFCYATCPLILERFERDLRAYGLGSFWKAPDNQGSLGDNALWRAPWLDTEVMVCSELAAEQALVLEDLVFDPRAVTATKDVDALGSMLGKLLPDNEKATQKRLSSQLVVLRDDYFVDLVRRTTPVQARVRLGENKTTSESGGNLWYEETLPADTLLASFVAERRTARNRKAESERDAKRNESNTRDFFQQLEEQMGHPLQIGGNETVGQGLCLWQKGVKSDG
jgi:CRISPR-associated protein Cmr4